MAKPRIRRIFFKGNCTHVQVDDKDVPLAKFKAKIHHELEIRQRDGSYQRLLIIEGRRETGEELPTLQVPADPAQLLKAMRTQWGTAAFPFAEIPGITVSALERQYARWMLGRKHVGPLRRIESTTGFTDRRSPKAFILPQGAITATGVDKRWKSNLPPSCLGDRPSLALGIMPETPQAATRQALALLDLSQSNPTLGLLILLAPLRAVTSVFRKIDGGLYFLSEAQAGLSSAAHLTRAFVGQIDRTARPTTWLTSKKTLLDALAACRNGVFVIQDHEAATPSNSRRSLDTIIEAVINQVCHDQTQSFDSCQLIGTGRHFPHFNAQALHTSVLYLPVDPSEVDAAALEPYWADAEQAVYLQVMEAFLKYILEDFEGANEQFSGRFQRAIDWVQARFPNDPARVQQLASLIATWNTFLRFAILRKVIGENEGKALFVQARKHLLELGQRQDEYRTPDLRETFLVALREGLRAGKVHLVDRKQGEQPAIHDPASVGWNHCQPQGIRLGWYDAEKDLAYIDGGNGQKGEATVATLLDLLPLHARSFYVQSDKQYKTFWSTAKRHGILIGSAPERNTNRVTLEGRNRYVYHIPLGLLAPTDEPARSESTT